jgi:ribosome-binding protein aMBF1 (putative translation factor)
MTNKEKFLLLVEGQDDTLLDDIKWRIDNQRWLKISHLIAFRILKRLDEINMTQKELAFLLKVSPQQVSKWVKGNENLTLETISKLEVALNIDLLYVAGFEEKQAPTVKAPAIRPSRKASNELKETTK